MTENQEEVFIRFRRKLADVVTVAINSGKLVSTAGVYCPLGCHPNSSMRKPLASLAAMAFNIAFDDALAFIRGFDHGIGVGPYGELGNLYRARFP